MILRTLAPLAAAAASLLLANTAGASGSMQAFIAGDYAAAREKGRVENSAEGLSVACRAGLVLGSYFEKGDARVGTLHGAIDDCAGALKTGGAKVDAYVNYAIGLAFEAKRINSPGLAGDTKRLLQTAVDRFPESGFARGALGGWHAQVAAQGMMARTVLGASRDEARKLLEASLKLDPGNVALQYEFLRFLALGGRNDRSEAAGVAATIAGMTPDDAFERLIQEHAARLGGALGESGKGSEKAVEAILKETESFAGFEGAGRGVRFAAPFNAFPSASYSAAAQ